ncbi:MAG: hypothetical protein HAW67_02530 [Endozoicomonadaceae bacterium]|nr:hypothetical protein [Endozoicomonadaceae bacterium]
MISQLTAKYPNQDSTFLIHSTQDFIYDELVVEVNYCSEQRNLSTQRLVNPAYTAERPKVNALVQNTSNRVISSRTQQLFAMLDILKSESSLINMFRIEDVQQAAVYEFHEIHWPKKNSPTLSYHEANILIRNVLTHANLPLIETTIEENFGKCCFRIKKINKDDYFETKKDVFQFIDEVDVMPQIRFNNMCLIFDADWGLQPDIILHELSHFISFMTPISETACNDLKKQSYFDLFFGGHGVLYSSVLFYLLEKFMHLDEQWLKEEFNTLRINYIPLENLEVQAINNSINIKLQEAL